MFILPVIKHFFQFNLRVHSLNSLTDLVTYILQEYSKLKQLIPDCYSDSPSYQVELNGTARFTAFKKYLHYV